MPFITSGTGASQADIHYVDYGSGQPIVLIHGWPLSHKAWEPQMADLVAAGYRVIAYDRRGFGASSAPWEGYDYDQLAADLHHLIQHLDLQEAVLVGFSMGGGEVVRYLSQYGPERIAKAALVCSIIPLVKQHPDNPAGVPQAGLDGIFAALAADRVGFLSGFLRNFFNYDDLKDRMSEAQLQYAHHIAAHASPRATEQCARAWADTDFRPELAQVTVPTLILHGNADNIVPIATSAEQAAAGIPDNVYHVIDGGSHGMNLTHRAEVNQHLLQFLKD